MSIRGFYSTKPFDFLSNSINYLSCPNKPLYRLINQTLGIHPGNIEPYEIALIHKSASVHRSDGIMINNERLEYLGDAILDAVIAHYLYLKFPEEQEGFLTQMRSKVVKGETLAQIAKKIGLAELLISQTSGFNGGKRIYEDAFEAIIGAIYIDKGFKATMDYVVKRIIKRFINIERLINIDTNYKSQLIEWGQKYKQEVEFYTDMEYPNSKSFICYIRINKKTYGSGKGISKKEAEQRAAKATLKQVEK